MKIIEENEQTIKMQMPCGRITLLSSQDRWVLNIFKLTWSGGYARAVRYIKTEFGHAKEQYYVHRLIVGAVKGFEIDHINRDKLDNRRENLRLASRGENSCNKAKAKNTTSKYRGVAYKANSKSTASGKPWHAYCSKNGKQHHLGYYKTEEEAALAYNAKSRELWGEFAFVNEVVF